MIARQECLTFFSETQAITFSKSQPEQLHLLCLDFTKRLRLHLIFGNSFQEWNYRHAPPSIFKWRS
ncbi:hypothetical protein IQ238_29945 [Pleurocapsales cyanobacterium LEGE 06147]|nr:hypothetical protein [Pleurocapsales cyanobacterium LEGE 06147]